MQRQDVAMTRHLRGSILVLSLVLTPYAIAANATDVAIGFADSTSTKVLVEEKLDRPKRMQFAVCDGGVFTVTYVAQQEAKPNNGRQSTRNFDKLGGVLYSITNPKNTSLELCVLFPSKLKSAPIMLDGDYAPCSEKTQQKIAKIHAGWKPKKCVSKVNSGESLEVGLVEYEAQKQHKLGRLFFVDRGSTSARDYPTEGCWRAEGECSFISNDAGSNFYPAFVIRDKFDLRVFLIWPGGEGEKSQFVEVSEGEVNEIKAYYRYLAPI